MSYEEMGRAARVQAAIMLIRYHQAVNTLLTELLDGIPQQYPYGREASQAVGRFRATVRAMIADWCQV